MKNGLTSSSAAATRNRGGEGLKAEFNWSRSEAINRSRKCDMIGPTGPKPPCLPVQPPPAQNSPRHTHHPPFMTAPRSSFLWPRIGSNACLPGRSIAFVSCSARVSPGYLQVALSLSPCTVRPSFGLVLRVLYHTLCTPSSRQRIEQVSMGGQNKLIAASA